MNKNQVLTSPEDESVLWRTTHVYQPTNRRGPNTRLTRRSTSPATVRKLAKQHYCKKVMKNPHFPVAKQTAISTNPSSATAERGAVAAG